MVDVKNVKNEIMNKMEKQPWVKYVIAFVAILIAANISATLTQSKTLAAVQPLQTEMTALKEQIGRLDARVTEIDEKTGGMLDLAEVKANAEALQKAAANFDTRLSAIVKAEGAKLDILEKDMTNQKSYVDELNKLLPGETGN